MNTLTIKSNCSDWCGCWNKKSVLADIADFATDTYKDDEWVEYVLDMNFDVNIPEHIIKTILDEDVSELKFTLDHYEVSIFKR